MIFSRVKTTALVLLCAPLLLLGMALLSGCDTDASYPEELEYTRRTDPLLTQPLLSDLNKDHPPTGFDRPGQFQHGILPELTDEDFSKQRALDPLRLKSEQSRELQAELKKFFGTPESPLVRGIDPDTVALLKLDRKTLYYGSQLYRVQCMHCHGLNGDGHGPTGPWVNPHPRDFRLGRFKFASSGLGNDQRKARRDDLIRTMRSGIEGASMPSFVVLHETELESLASYVIHLSIRGQVEYQRLEQLLKGDENALSVEDWIGAISALWVETAKNPLQPGPFHPSTPDQLTKSVERGRNLFVKAGDQGGAGCLGCHLNYGRQYSYQYDAWGTIVKPANLTTGIYRGGRRPIDLFWRIKAGINGSGMPSQDLDADKIWDVVNFVQALPHTAMRQKYNIVID